MALGADHYPGTISGEQVQILVIEPDAVDADCVRVQQTEGGQVPDRACPLGCLDHPLFLAAFRYMDKEGNLPLGRQFLGPLQGLIRAGIGGMGKDGWGDAGMSALPRIEKFGHCLQAFGRVGHARGGKINDPLGGNRPHPRIHKGLRRLAFKDLDAAFKECLAAKLTYAAKKGGWIHPLSVSLWKSLHDKRS